MEPTTTKAVLPENPSVIQEPPERFLDPDHWVDAYGDYLYRCALQKVRDPAIAEDLVQETFLAALKSQKSFQGKASEKNWLVGILKNKVMDFWRKKSREEPLADLEALQHLEETLKLAEGLYPEL